MNVRELISEHIGQRTPEELSADCGDFPSASRIRGLLERDSTAFPSKETLTGLARGLGLENIDVAHAWGVSLGLWGADAVPRKA